MIGIDRDKKAQTEAKKECVFAVEGMRQIMTLRKRDGEKSFGMMMDKIKSAPEILAIYISHVFPNSAAGRSGVKKGWRIVSVQGRKVETMDMSEIICIFRNSENADVEFIQMNEREGGIDLPLYYEKRMGFGICEKAQKMYNGAAKTNSRMEIDLSVPSAFKKIASGSKSVVLEQKKDFKATDASESSQMHLLPDSSTANHDRFGRSESRNSANLSQYEKERGYSDINHRHTERVNYQSGNDERDRGGKINWKQIRHKGSGRNENHHGKTQASLKQTVYPSAMHQQTNQNLIMEFTRQRQSLTTRRIMAMGFTKEDAEASIIACGDNPDDCMVWLISHLEEKQYISDLNRASIQSELAKRAEEKVSMQREKEYLMQAKALSSIFPMSYMLNDETSITLSDLMEMLIGQAGSECILRKAIMQLLKLESQAIKWYRGASRCYLLRVMKTLEQAFTDIRHDINNCSCNSQEPKPCQLVQIVQGEVEALQSHLFDMPENQGGVPVAFLKVDESMQFAIDEDGFEVVEES